MRPGKDEDENETAIEERLTVEIERTEEDSAEILGEVLGMEVKEEGQGEEWGDWSLRSLEAIEFLTQDAEPSGTTLVDACNGFNELSHLVILWTVQHRWQEGARFAFNSGPIGVLQGYPSWWYCTGSPSSPWPRS